MKDAAAAYRQAWLTQHGASARSATATATGTATTAAGAAGTAGMGGKSPAAAAAAAAAATTTAGATEDSLLPVSIMYLDSMSSGLHGVEICRTLHR